MSFDGTDDYATFDIGSGNLTEPMSVEMWCYIKNDESKALWSWGGAYMLWLYFNRIGYNTANSDSWGFFYDTSAMINKWAHFVFEMRSNVSTTNNKIYWNGVSQTLSWVFGSADASALRSFENGKGAFACRLDFGTPNLFTPVDVGVFRIYRGALTEEEVTRNYNALRGRYGV
jgi:hypothetical protein